MDTPATLAFLGCCADRQASQPLFPKGNMWTIPQLLFVWCFSSLLGSHSSYRWTALGWPKAKYKGLQKAQEINFVNGKPSGWKWTLLSAFPRECIIRTESQNPPAHTICPFPSQAPLLRGDTRGSGTLAVPKESYRCAQPGRLEPAVSCPPPPPSCLYAVPATRTARKQPSKQKSKWALASGMGTSLSSPCHRKPGLEQKPLLCQRRRIHKGPPFPLSRFLRWDGERQDAGKEEWATSEM